MPASSKLDVLAVIKGLTDCFPRQAITKQTIGAYAHMLRDIPPDVLQAAAAHCTARSPFFPAISELREAAFDIMDDVLNVPCAAEAWAEVCQRMRYGGRQAGPEFSHDLVAEAVESIGGWYMLCGSETPAADRARFMEAYRELHQRARERQRMLPEVRAAAERYRIGAGDMLQLEAP